MLRISGLQLAAVQVAMPNVNAAITRHTPPGLKAAASGERGVKGAAPFKDACANLSLTYSIPLICPKSQSLETKRSMPM
jgi:hypothetical protein